MINQLLREGLKKSDIYHFGTIMFKIVMKGEAKEFDRSSI